MMVDTISFIKIDHQILLSSMKNI